MKKHWFLTLVVMVAIFMVTGLLYAQTVTLVKAEGGWDGDLKFEKGEKSITVTIPTFNGQPNITGQTLGVFRSYAKTSDGKIFQIPTGINHKVTAQRVDSANVKADLGLSNGKYRLRIWGVYANQEPMFINQASIFYRHDAKGKPAYEALVDASTGKAEPVPANHPAWE